jgi:hypothetical protein
LGQEVCAEKSNELTAIPVLLDALMSQVKILLQIRFSRFIDIHFSQ